MRTNELRPAIVSALAALAAALLLAGCSLFAPGGGSPEQAFNLSGDTLPPPPAPEPTPAGQGLPDAPAARERFPVVQIPGRMDAAVVVSEAPEPPSTPAVPAPEPAETQPPPVTPGEEAATPTPGQPLMPVYRLRPGDVVGITLRTPGPTSFEDTLDEVGEITLPHLGRMKAEGLTARELSAKIEKAYVDGAIFKRVQVIVATPQHRYTVSGEVRVPGFQIIQGRATLLQTIPAAGGFNEWADRRKITIKRKGQVIPVNYIEIERDPEKDIEIEPGDIIHVPRAHAFSGG